MNITITKKGWIKIPVEIQEKYKLVPGSKVTFVDYGGVIAIVPAMEDPVEQAAGMLEGASSLTETLLQEHKTEGVRGKYYRAMQQGYTVKIMNEDGSVTLQRFEPKNMEQK